MAGSGGQEKVRSHLEEKVPEKQGLLGRVKDSLNFTKHLGFISDLDSPASQAALAEEREREEREGVKVEVPQAPISERVMQGVTNVANTASVIATGASGGVAPRGQELPEEAESDDSLGHPVSGTAGDKGQEPGHPKSIVSGTAGDKGLEPGHPESIVSGTNSDKKQDLTNAPTPKQSEQQQKHSWTHRAGHKDHEAEAAEKDGHSFSKWAVRTAQKLGHVVASKDLTDDPSVEAKPGKK